MSIANESRQTEQFTALTADDVLTSTGAAAVIFDVLQPITVLRVGVLVTVAVVAKTTVPVVRFDKYVTPDSATSKILGLNGTTAVDGDAIVTVPDGTAIGEIVYADVRIDMDPGTQIVPFVKTACSGANQAGSARYYFEYINRHETPDNISNMIESA